MRGTRSSPSSRPPAAGSIAAVRADVVAALRLGGHPAHQRRAPLRRARPRRASRTAPVIPPTSGGLHCGTACPVDDVAVFPGHPAHQRRAPLRPCLSAGRSRRGPPGHPAHQRRAPLRLEERQGPHLRRDYVIPPTSGGLHCGWMMTCVSTTGWRSSRPPVAGSIAARRTTRMASRSGGRSSRPPVAGSIAAGGAAAG